jgi:hypothetical protein
MCEGWQKATDVDRAFASPYGVSSVCPLGSSPSTRRSDAESRPTEGIRMSKFSKAGLLIAAMALCGLLASSAGAAEWHTNGIFNTSSTNAGASRLVIHPHATPHASVAIGCTTSSGHVRINGPTSTLFPWTNAATVTPTFSGCTTAGGAGFTVLCGPAELRAISYVGGETFATAGGGVTTGTVTNIDCRVSIGATACVTITGSVHGHYINPTPMTTGAGRLTLTATGQSLTGDQLNACAAIPAGSATFGSPGATGTTVNDLTYTVDGPEAPYIYRTT